MRVEVSAGSRVLDAATTGVAIAYSPELRFIGTDLPFLRQVASAGGGVVLSSAGEALVRARPSRQRDPVVGRVVARARRCLAAARRGPATAGHRPGEAGPGVARGSTA